MWGIVPAAGIGSRIQPLAFSKELLPVGSRVEQGAERPRAVSEYIVERMIAGGADKICFVIAPGKSDILSYYGGAIGGASIAYVVQPGAGGLCDAVFRAVPLVSENEDVVVGLPDTIWFPEDALRALPTDVLSFLLFPVDRPEYFDSVELGPGGSVARIHVKSARARSRWIWGAFRMPGRVFHDLYRLWRRPGRGDEYVGTLVNAWIDGGGRAAAVKAGAAYVDVGTLNGYREAIALLAARPGTGAPVPHKGADPRRPGREDSAGRRAEPGSARAEPPHATPSEAPWSKR